MFELQQAHGICEGSAIGSCHTNDFKGCADAKLSVMQGLRDLETVLAEAQQVIIRADIFTNSACDCYHYLCVCNWQATLGNAACGL